MRITAYDDWCMKNGIKSPSYFLDDILKLGEHDERFKEAADYLRKLEDTKLDIEPDIDNVEAFKSRMVHCYGFGLIPSFELLYYVLNKDTSIDNLKLIKNNYELCISELHKLYRDDYAKFVESIHYLIDNIMKITNEYTNKINNKNYKSRYSSENLEILKNLILA